MRETRTEPARKAADPPGGVRFDGLSLARQDQVAAVGYAPAGAGVSSRIWRWLAAFDVGLAEAWIAPSSVDDPASDVVESSGRHTASAASLASGGQTSVGGRSAPW